jgi:hypothetical protein
MKHWFLFALLLSSPPALADSIQKNAIDTTATAIHLTRKDIARIHTYRYNLPHAPTTLQQSRNAMLSLYYVHSPHTTFTAQFGATTISNHQGDGTHQKDLSAYLRPTGNPSFDLTRLFYHGDADSTALSTNAEGLVIGDEGHVLQDPLNPLGGGFTLDADGMFQNHLYPAYARRATQYRDVYAW